MNSTQKKISFIIGFIFILVIMINIISGQGIWNIEPFNSSLNDEFYYLKQVEGVLEYGRPMGYFGFNFSEAKILTFSAWSPLLIYFLAFFSVIFPFADNPVYFVNTLLIVFSALFLCNSIKKQPLFFIYIPLISFVLIRSIYSGMSEAVFLSSAMILFGMIQRKTKLLYQILFILLISLMKLPFIVFLIVVVLFCDESNRRTHIITLIGGMSAVVAYFIISYFFCASYFEVTLNHVNIIKLFEINPFNTIANIINYVCERLHIVVSLIFSNSFSFEAIIHRLFLILDSLLVVKFLISKYSRDLIFSSINILIYISFLMLYVPDNIGRHILPLVLFLILYLLYYSKHRIIRVLTILILLLNNIGFLNDNNNLYNSVDQVDLNLDASELSKLNIQKDDYRKNTIIIEYGNNVNLYKYLYNIKPGFGYNMVRESVLGDNPYNLEYGYIILDDQSPNIDLLYVQYEIIVNNSEFVLMRHRELFKN